MRANFRGTGGLYLCQAAQVAVAKRTVTVNAGDALKDAGSSGVLEIEDEVAEYIEQLRDKLLSAVKSGDRVRIK